MMQAYVGMIVLYRHPKVEHAAPALVTFVLPDGRVNATVFTDSGRSFPVYNVPSDPTADIRWERTSG